MELALTALIVGGFALSVAGIILATWYGGRAWGGWYGLAIIACGAPRPPRPRAGAFEDDGGRRRRV